MAKEFWVLVIVIFSAYGFHCVMRDLRNGKGFWGHMHRVEEWLANRHKATMAIDFLMVNATGWSPSGAMRKRHMDRAGYDPNEMPNAGMQLIQRNGNLPGRAAGFLDRIAGGGAVGDPTSAVRNAVTLAAAEDGAEATADAAAEAAKDNRPFTGREGYQAGFEGSAKAGAAMGAQIYAAAGRDPAEGARIGAAIAGPIGGGVGRVIGEAGITGKPPPTPPEPPAPKDKDQVRGETPPPWSRFPDPPAPPADPPGNWLG